jgi:hypothetical protein
VLSKSSNASLRRTSNKRRSNKELECRIQKPESVSQEREARPGLLVRFVLVLVVVLVLDSVWAEWGGIEIWTGIKVDFCPEGTTGLSLGS